METFQGTFSGLEIVEIVGRKTFDQRQRTGIQIRSVVETFFHILEAQDNENPLNEATNHHPFQLNLQFVGIAIEPSSRLDRTLIQNVFEIR